MELSRNAERLGYSVTEASWVLADNRRANRTMRLTGARVIKKYRSCQRPVERLTRAPGQLRRPRCQWPVRRSPDDNARRDMGTWDIGPFNNDTAADFGGDLDEAATDERESMIRAVLKRAADAVDHLGISEGERAVAAVALVVGQHPDGEPACSNYGLSEPLPALPADLRTLAVDALDQVVSELSELAEQWVEATNGSKWHQDIKRLRDVLDPPIPPQEETLFEI